MAATLLLDRLAWDLALTANGNIAAATEPYSQVQDAASACRLLEGEAFYDTTIGVPYFQQILGQFQPLQVLREKLGIEAATVPGVSSANAVLEDLAGRSLSGQVQITTASGVQTVTL